MSANAKPSVLVIGGVGFVGYHVVKAFVAQPSFGAVAVLSRSATSSKKNHVEGATYYDGSLTDPGGMARLIDEIQPTIIIQAATPSPITALPKDYERVTFDGTGNLLKIAKASKHVRAFIFTSSSVLAKGHEHLNLTEKAPLANEDPKADPYSKFKALAEILVLKENDPLSNEAKGDWQGHIATGSLRFPIIYGTHDVMTISGCLERLQKGQTYVQLGEGKNLWDICSADNCADSHVVLAEALLSGGTASGAKVDGEAFNIHDGVEIPFWTWVRAVWAYAGHNPTKPEKVITMPTWLAVGISTILELLYWVFTFGTKRPFDMGQQQIEYSCFTHTYNIEKARSRLGFQPKQDWKGALKEAVEWSLEEGGWAEKLKHVRDKNA
jgi:sterol-4alpha-carboxylate 3-dehydrogenase (decarboxylating)